MCIAPVHVERLRTMVRRIGFDACRVDMGLECWLCLHVKNRAQAAQIAYELKDKAMEMVAEIKRKTKARSKDANAYAWELMGQMADLLHTDKDSVYLEMLKRYGQQFVVKVPNKSVEMFKRQYKYCEQHETLAPEERAQYYRVYLGSSTYTTKEMSVLIDGIVSECKDLGIETMTPEELARIKEEPR